MRKESLSGSITEEGTRLVHIISHAGGILKERGGVMLVVSDSVTALLPIFCTHEEEGVG